PRNNERRPSGDFTTNTFASNGAWSYYHALQVEWNKKLSQGFFFQMSYTWSKAIDTTSEATFVGADDHKILGPDPRVSRGSARFWSFVAVPLSTPVYSIHQLQLAVVLDTK